MRNRHGLMIAAALQLTACMNLLNPPTGHGGAAEIALVSPEITFPDNATVQGPLLQQQYMMHQLHIRILALSGATHCLPAQLHLAQQGANTSLRLLHAQRFEDARLQMIKLQRHLLTMDQQLGYLIREVHCAPATTSINAQDTLHSTQLQALAAQPIHFAVDSNTLSNDAYLQLQQMALHMAHLPHVVLQINGFTDIRGTEHYNQALGLRRGEAIAHYLQSLGIATDRLQVMSFGEAFPIQTEISEAAHQQNRRAQFQLLNLHATTQAVDTPTAGVPQHQWFKSDTLRHVMPTHKGAYYE